MNNKNILSFVMITFIFFTVNCVKNDFKYNSLQAKHILDKATQKIVRKSMRNTVENGEIKGTIIEYDSLKAKNYLKSNEKEFYEYYKYLKDNLTKHPAANDLDDKLYVLAYLNFTWGFITGSYIEEPCKYIKLIKNKKKFAVSKWVYDDFFASLRDDKTFENWGNMDNEKKKEIILGYLFAPVNGKKCAED